MLTIKNLSKSYRGAKALENVSFTLHNGLYGLLDVYKRQLLSGYFRSKFLYRLCRRDVDCE